MVKENEKEEKMDRVCQNCLSFDSDTGFCRKHDIGIDTPGLLLCNDFEQNKFNRSSVEYKLKIDYSFRDEMTPKQIREIVDKILFNYGPGINTSMSVTFPATIEDARICCDLVSVEYERK